MCIGGGLVERIGIERLEIALVGITQCGRHGGQSSACQQEGGRCRPKSCPDRHVLVVLLWSSASVSRCLFLAGPASSRLFPRHGGEVRQVAGHGLAPSKGEHAWVSSPARRSRGATIVRRPRIRSPQYTRPAGEPARYRRARRPRLTIRPAETVPASVPYDTT